MVTSVQRFGGALNAHAHFHTLVLDGVFVREPDGTLRFHPAAPPTDDDVRRVVGRTRRRLDCLGLAGATCSDEDADPLADESTALAGLAQAAILGRAALGPGAGRGPVRVGAAPDAPWIERHVPLHAHDGGVDLHAAVHVEAGDRERLERLCQYLCRPPIGQGRLGRLRDGRIAVRLQRPWADGTTHLVFTPMELLQRLVPLVPRPRINLLLRGALAVVSEAEDGTVTIRANGNVLPARLYLKDQAQLNPGIVVDHKHLDGAFDWIAAQQQQRDARRLESRKLTHREKQRIRAGAGLRTPAALLG